MGNHHQHSQLAAECARLAGLVNQMALTCILADVPLPPGLGVADCGLQPVQHSTDHAAAGPFPWCHLNRGTLTGTGLPCARPLSRGHCYPAAGGQCYPKQACGQASVAAQITGSKSAAALTVLDVAYDTLDASALSALVQACPNLVSLNLSHCLCLEAAACQQLSGLRRLSHLSVDGCHIDAAAFDALLRLPSLLTLSCAHTCGSWEDLPSGPVSSLTAVDVSGAALSSTTLEVCYQLSSCTRTTLLIPMQPIIDCNSSCCNSLH